MPIRWSIIKCKNSTITIKPRKYNNIWYEVDMPKELRYGSIINLNKDAIACATYDLRIHHDLGPAATNPVPGIYLFDPYTMRWEFFDKHWHEWYWYQPSRLYTQVAYNSDGNDELKCYYSISSKNFELTMSTLLKSKKTLMR